jgi:hypothetical protein
MPSTTTDEPVFGVALYDWISEEPVGKDLKMLCWGCGETATLHKEGVKFVGFIQFFRDHRHCIEFPKEQE